MAGQILELIPDGKLAREAYQEFSRILKAKKDKSLAVWIEMMDANSKRVELPGKEMAVKGKTITGEDFDIKSYRGKITLVYFWATWEASVKHEYLYMKKLYLDYRDKGFEIVAISVDDDREKLEAFIREYEVPWINLWDEENRTSPVAVTQHGISAIPTMILLDREGKVVSMEARGLLLGKLLERYIDGVQAQQATQPKPTAARDK
jgi:peroxiredoxin